MKSGSKHKPSVADVCDVADLVSMIAYEVMLGNDGIGPEMKMREQLRSELVKLIDARISKSVETPKQT